jgi:hypothetical protein
MAKKMVTHEHYKWLVVLGIMVALSLSLAAGSQTAHAVNVPFGLQQIISTEADGAQSAYAADLDGDGDLDVLSASEFDNKIAWYQNNGAGGFGPQQIISTEAGSARSVFAADLDGDGGLDVLSASLSDDKIAWYQNNGMGGFGPQQIISTDANAADSVFAADLDGDGDLDVLSASTGDDKIAWYENNGVGGFGPQQIISTEADLADSVFAADLDGDGDMDVLSASRGDDKIAWYENNGVGGFGAQQIISTDADFARSVFAADLDGDGDMDVLSASNFDDKIAWYENNGAGGFGPQQIISTDADGAGSVFAADLDGDGDMDVLSASELDDKIAWYENNGAGGFGPQQIISNNAEGASVYAASLDDDGDPDVLSASFSGDKIAWYENQGLRIMAMAGPGGSISPSGTVPVSPATDQTFTITPDDGFQVVDVLVDGSSEGAVTEYTFENVMSNHTIEATFEPVAVTHTIEAMAGPGGSISPSDNVTVAEGEDQTFTITPDAGFQVADVLVDGATVGAVTSHTFDNVMADHTIDATFESIPDECQLGGAQEDSIVAGTISVAECSTFSLLLSQQPSTNINAKLFVGLQAVNAPGLSGFIFFRPLNVPLPDGSYVKLVKDSNGFLPDADEFFFSQGPLSTTAEDLSFDVGTAGLGGLTLIFETSYVEEGMEFSEDNLMSIQRVVVDFQ